MLYLTGEPKPWFAPNGLRTREDRIWKKYPLLELIVMFKRRLEHFTGRPKWKTGYMIPHNTVKYDPDTGNLIRWNRLLLRYLAQSNIIHS